VLIAEGIVAADVVLIGIIFVAGGEKVVVGIVFPPGDIEQMKERLLYLKHHPEEIERISRNNLSDVHRFTVERQAEKYLDIYRNVLNYDQGHF